MLQTNVCVPLPSNSYVEALTPNVVVLGGEVLRRQRGLDEVMGVGPCGGLVPL